MLSNEQPKPRRDRRLRRGRGGDARSPTDNPILGGNTHSICLRGLSRGLQFDRCARGRGGILFPGGGSGFIDYRTKVHSDSVVRSHPPRRVHRAPPDSIHALSSSPPDDRRALFVESRFLAIQAGRKNSVPGGGSRPPLCCDSKLSLSTGFMREPSGTLLI